MFVVEVAVEDSEIEPTLMHYISLQSTNLTTSVWQREEGPHIFIPNNQPLHITINFHNILHIW